MNTRKLKFRIWSKITRSFDDSFKDYGSEHCAEIYGDFRSNFFEALDDVLENEDYVIQQWTGLTDKNDKEIYEGDIIHRYFSDDNQYTYLVDYNQEDCVYVLKKGNEESFMFYVPVKTFEVIGTFFENPELLK